MRKQDLTIGDRVVVIEGHFAGVKELSGRVGTVVGFSGNGLIGVEFDLPFAQGHDCGGAGRSGHCRFGVAAQLEFADEGTLPEQIAFSYGDLMGI